MAKSNVRLVACITEQHQQHLHQQEVQFGQRFDVVIAQLQQERATARALRASLEAKCEQSKALLAETKAAHEHAIQVGMRLRTTIAVKQEVITLLLPYYPHRISPELRRQIDLR